MATLLLTSQEFILFVALQTVLLPLFLKNILFAHLYFKNCYDILPAVWVSSGCVAKSEESVINEGQQQASLTTESQDTNNIFMKRFACLKSH